MDFSKLLKHLRTEKGIGIKKLASDVGLNYTYISKLENAKGKPSLKVLNKFSHYFNYNIDELMIAAGKIPKDIEKILKGNPKEAIRYLRSEFGGGK